MKTNQDQKNIPTGWKQVTLGDLFDFKNGLNSEKENFGHGVRFINIMEILKHDFLVAEDIPGRINVDPKRNKENLVEYGDVLFNRTSETPDEVGMTSVYLDTEPVVFGGFVIRAKPKSKDLNDLFKKYCFSSEQFRKEVIKQGQGVVRGNIGQSNLRVTPFLLPPKGEQARIATVLETWNKTIEKISNKIEVKKQIKESLVEDLLTGKKRVRGFSEKWKKVKLGDYIFEINEYTESHDEFEILTSSRSGLVLQSEYFKKQVTSKNNAGYKVIRKGEFTYRAMSDSEVFSFNRLEVVDVGAVSPAYAVFQIKKINPEFIEFLMKTPWFIHQAYKYAQGGTRLSLKLENLMEVQVNIPEIAEQDEIAKILTTAKLEVIELEKKLSILKEQKRYLLNNLITGTIRTPETLSTKITK